MVFLGGGAYGSLPDAAIWWCLRTGGGGVLTSHNQGGIALLWKESHPRYEVELARIATPKLLTFQLVTGDE